MYLVTYVWWNIEGLWLKVLPEAVEGSVVARKKNRELSLLLQQVQGRS